MPLGLGLNLVTNRVGVYLALMDDRYPSTDDHQSSTLTTSIPMPNVISPVAAAGEVAAGDPALRGPVLPGHRRVRGRHRGVFAILFTGSYPRGMFGFVEGSSGGTSG
jgi:hypothetical protein